jgi:hypothetical protein
MNFKDGSFSCIKALPTSQNPVIVILRFPAVHLRHAMTVHASKLAQNVMEVRY